MASGNLDGICRVQDEQQGVLRWTPEEHRTKGSTELTERQHR